MAQRKRLLVRSSDKWEKWRNYLFQFQNFSLQLNAFTIYNFYALQECNQAAYFQFSMITRTHNQNNRLA